MQISQQIFSYSRHCTQSMLAVFVLLSLTSCGDDAIMQQAMASTLVYCSEASPETFNPQTTTSGSTFDASARPLYNRLVEFKPGTLEVLPSLAKTWKVNSKGTVYTFELRKNVHFHTTPWFSPTRPFNADDVIFSFNRQRRSQDPFHVSSQQDFPYFETQGLNDLIVDIKKLDNYRVQFKLSKTTSPFLSILAMEFASILSAEYAEQLLEKNAIDNLSSKPIGTGPFKLKRYQPDAFIRYEAHEHYWKTKEKLKHLVFAITPDPYLRFARLTAGECDVMSNPLPVHLSALAKEDDLNILSTPGLNIAYWAFNTRKPPLDNPLVRKALSHAVNREAIIKAVYRGSAEIAKNPIPPGMWSYNHSIEDHEYDPQYARNLLYRAGYPDGFSLDIWAFSEQRSYNPNSRKTAELIQQDLRKIGLTVKIVNLELATLLKKVRQGEHKTALLGWVADNGDPDNFLGTLLSCEATKSGQNSSFWCNEEFDSIIKDARSIHSKRQRTKLYKRAQSIFKKEAPWMTLAHTRQTLILRDRVKNLVMSPAGGVSFSKVELAEAKQEETN
ncbi:ABC transporter substrate-binding protein [Pleionea sp. CnH1-48]|uniref:ABC transporter substrate-binding protein n=1 Tax=Pleionea sp. CnH1-48 TaxID=2954494 RepID=UPI002097DE25|nr:ABC transporter substrate-binding protein [Pleionea sp. CnH1-48]MCO7225448.1 ABC transporter substrate-binding protein [Pleionea sp. CnH1-48]